MIEKNKEIGALRIFFGVRILEKISQGYYNITIKRKSK